MQENVVLKPSGLTRAPYTQASDDWGWQQTQTDGLNAGEGPVWCAQAVMCQLRPAAVRSEAASCSLVTQFNNNPKKV